MPQRRDQEQRLDRVSAIMAYESGDLDDDDTVALFQELADTGLLYSLQGSYGRTARDLADAGLITL